MAQPGWVVQRKRPTDQETKGFCFRPTTTPPPPGTDGAPMPPPPRMPTHATLAEFTPRELGTDIRAPNPNQVKLIGWDFFNLRVKVLDIFHMLRAGVTLFPRDYFGFNPREMNPARRHDLRVQPMTIIESRPKRTGTSTPSAHLSRVVCVIRGAAPGPALTIACSPR